MKMPQFKPLIPEVLAIELADYINGGGYLTEHTHTKKFAANLSRETGADYCSITTSGTLALVCALRALGIGHGDEVIVPNYTMAATAFAAVEVGASVKFVDIEPNSLCANLSQIKEAISPATKAVILMIANGRYPEFDVSELHLYLQQKKIFLVEDAAQGLGSYYPSGAHVGTVSDAGILSFSMPKIITTGQGGAVLTNDPAIHSKIESYKNFGRSGSGNDIHSSIGSNVKFTDLQAIAGLCQLDELAERVAEKKKIYSYLAETIDNPNLKLIENDTRHTAPWFYEITCCAVAELRLHLDRAEIGWRPMYPPLNKQQCFQNHKQAECNFPISNFIGSNGTWIPSYIPMDSQEMAHLASTLNTFRPA